MLHEVSLVLAGIVVLTYGVDFLFNHLDDPREPRRVSPPIPLVGHVLGLLRHGFGYYGIASQKTNAEMYTVGILNFKIYVVRSLRLTQVVQRSKKLSFRPFLRVSNAVVSDDAHALFDGALLDTFSVVTRETLMPGPQLDVQNLRMANEVVSAVDSLLDSHDELELLRWAKHTIVQATATGLYGVQHPFKDDPATENALWDWEDRRPRLDVGIDPLRRGHTARAKVFEAFRVYFQNVPKDVSPMIRERERLLVENGIGQEDRVRMQATLSTAAYPNTVPALFWTVYEIYSRPELLEAIRQEISHKAVRRCTLSDGSSSGGGFILDIAALQTECHILLSTFQETQRTRHTQVAFRMVLEDTVLDGKYLLKKGNMVHVPAKPTHDDAGLWGAEAGAFDPYRFVPEEGKTKAVTSSFVAWGRPPHLCPARQFAATELLVTVALLTMRMDLAPLAAAGRKLKGWGRPTVKPGMEVPTIPRPKDDLRLRVTARKESAGSWEVKIGEGKTRISLASG